MTQKEIDAPYELPEGWKWAKIKDCFDVTSSKRVLKEDWKEKGIPFYRTRELVKLSENGFVDNELFIDKSYYDELKEKYGVPKIDDLLISGVGTIGVPFVITTEDEFYFKDGNVIWFKNKGKTIPNYIFYLYKSDFIINQIHNMSAGTTVDTYTIVNAMNTIIPIPPTLAEQQRIVNRIETMFAKLDQAQEKAQAVLDSFETRKAAILHKSFTGQLTANWRKANGVPDDSWEEKKIGEICTVVRGGSPRPAGDPKYYDGSIPFMKVADITGNDSKYVYSTEYTIKEAGLHKTRMVDSGTLLLTNSGATLGVPAITKIKTTFNDGIAAFLNLPEESNLYFYYFWASKTTELRTINMGAAQPNLNIDIISNIIAPVPTSSEQQEIVRILDNVLEKESRAKEAAQTVLDQIALLKKSILA
ncbi:MAG: restriction endonuclease subunit S, partial [Treponema sp.]|nr:restriction endonuclease subunit S [Treponema sp.]